MSPLFLQKGRRGREKGVCLSLSWGGRKKQKKPLWLSCSAGWVHGYLHAPGVPCAASPYLAGSWSVPGIGCGEEAGRRRRRRSRQRVKQGELAACRVTADKQSKTTLTLTGICQANRSYFYRRLFAYILTKNPGLDLISLKCNEKYHFSTPLPPFLHVFSRHSCAESCISKISWPLVGFKIVLFSAALPGCSLFL